MHKRGHCGGTFGDAPGPHPPGVTQMGLCLVSSPMQMLRRAMPCMAPGRCRATSPHPCPSQSSPRKGASSRCSVAGHHSSGGSARVLNSADTKDYVSLHEPVWASGQQRAPACATSLSTGGGPVSYVLLSEGGFQVVYPLDLWSRFSGVVKVRFGYG